MTEENTQHVMLEAVLYAMTGMQVAFDEEQFIITCIAGGQARPYSVSPKHAKRMAMLFTKQVTAYEKKYGGLETLLPEAREVTSEQPIGFVASVEK